MTGVQAKTSGPGAQALAGLLFVVGLVAIVAVSLTMFAGGFTTSVPVTVISDRAGLVMDPDAKVKLRGVQVGRVSAISTDGDRARLTLAMDPGQMRHIPSNTLAEIRSVTFFGAKFVDLIPPEDASTRPLAAHAILQSRSVTVEFNTLFDQLTDVLSRVQPEKLNATLGALATAFRGKGAQFGDTLDKFNETLKTVNPTLPTFSTDLQKLNTVVRTYASVSDPLVNTLRSSTTISTTLVEKERQLDRLLSGVIGLSDVGDAVVGRNADGLVSTARALVPTLDLTSEYNVSFGCTLGGFKNFYNRAELMPYPFAGPGAVQAVSFLAASPAYKYPTNLPKLTRAGRTYCGSLPRLPYDEQPQFLVADYGANPFEGRSKSTQLNVESFQQLLFGPPVGLAP